MQHYATTNAIDAAIMVPPRGAPPGGGSLAEGVLDLAYREVDAGSDGWTVVDFRTNREFSTASSHYVAQVRLYLQAVVAATGLLAGIGRTVSVMRSPPLLPGRPQAAGW